MDILEGAGLQENVQVGHPVLAKFAQVCSGRGPGAEVWLEGQVLVGHAGVWCTVVARSLPIGWGRGMQWQGTEADGLEGADL